LNKERLIDETTASLMKYTDVDIREKSCGILFFEEKIHILSLMISHFNTNQSLNFVITVKFLLNFSSNGEEVAPFGKLNQESNPNREQEVEHD